MDIETACAEYEKGRLKEAIIEPADEGNGWMVLIRMDNGGLEKITDHRGAEKVYHTIDHATEIAKQIGFRTVRVEERF